MPKAGKDLVAYSGKEVIHKVGADVIKRIVVSILCGENVRDLTEDLTKRRVSIINGALLALFIKGSCSIDNFSNKLPELIKNELNLSPSKTEKDILLWLLGLTSKGVQNILRGKQEELHSYINRLKENSKRLAQECDNSYGELKGTLILGRQTANVDWNMILPLLNAVGTETLAIRGAEKSMYGKLFERLVLGSCLSILGFQKINPLQDSQSNKVFWLSSRGSKRESDATALYQAGKGFRFDIGFIGPGNTEISFDKVSRFEREMEFGEQKHYMATFIIVDRIGQKSRIVDLAKNIDETIIQMSMSFWPKIVAERLKETVGFKHEIQKLKDKDIGIILRML